MTEPSTATMLDVMDDRVSRAAQSLGARLNAANADYDVLLARGMGAGAYASMKLAGIRPILTDISLIDAAVQAVIEGQIVDHTEILH
jgi:predicted Fe-Mo cluster-binding NifX family protein